MPEVLLPRLAALVAAGGQKPDATLAKPSTINFALARAGLADQLAKSGSSLPAAILEILKQRDLLSLGKLSRDLGVTLEFEKFGQGAEVKYVARYRGRGVMQGYSPRALRPERLSVSNWGGSIGSAAMPVSFGLEDDGPIFPGIDPEDPVWQEPATDAEREAALMTLTVILNELEVAVAELESEYASGLQNCATSTAVLVSYAPDCAVKKVAALAAAGTTIYAITR